jgi:hypothetical protein
MGGGTSKFDDTDWEKANGTFNGEALLDTIDGGSPTSRYQKYELHKNAYNQREFNVVDAEDKTLLFTTKAVPGTLAWFDVLGPTSCGDYKDLKLRVQVDLSRRTWIVYRYHTPVFQGQKPAKLPVRKGLDDTKDNPDDNAKLYKTACITVSWSRYIAVVARYGPPSFEEFFVEDSSSTDNDYDDKGDDTIRIPTASSDSGDDIFAQAQTIAARRRVENPMDDDDIITYPADAVKDDDDDNDDDEEGNSKPSHSEKAKKLLSSAVSSLNTCTSSPTKKNLRSPESSQHDPSSFYTKKSPLHHPPSSAATAIPQSNNNKNGPKTRSRWPFSSIFTGASSSSFHPATTKSESPKLLTKEQKRRAAYETALEGTIDLDGRLLECQEIYNKIIGTHQTSLVSKDRVVKLLQLDEAQHQAATTTTSIQDDDDQEEEGDPFIQAVHQEKQHPSDDETKDGWFSDQQKRLAWKYFGYELAEQAAQAKPTTPTNEFEASLKTIVQKSIVEQHQEQPKSTPPQRQMPWYESNEMAEQEAKSPISTNEFEASLQTTFQKKQTVSQRTSWFGFGKGKCKDAGSSSTTTKVEEVTESAREEILASCTLEQLQGDDGDDGDDDEPNKLLCPQSVLLVKDKDNLPNLLDDDEIAPLALSLAAKNGEAQSADTGNDSSEPIAAATESDPVASYSEKESSSGLTDEKDEFTEQEAVEHDEDSSKLLENGHASSAMPSLLSSSSSSSVEGQPKDLKEPLVHGEKPSSTTTPSLPTKGKDATEQDEEPQPQPLVGYWTWKHTYTVHKVEMHLATNSDLALHVVLAILVNQVRYERNALAMTV